MSMEGQQTTQEQVETVTDYAQFIAQASLGQVAPIVQVADVNSPILQVSEAMANGSIIQVSDNSAAPVVHVADGLAQGVYITEQLPNGVQIMDASFPYVQCSDTVTPMVQIAQAMAPGSVGEGLTQVVQFPGGQIALVEQQENIDPQTIQHLVLEQLPAQATEQPQEEATPAKLEIRPPVGKGPFKCEICEKMFPKWNQYQRHMKSHEEDKPYRCTQCPMSFNIADNLKLHLATHTSGGENPVCPECGKRFSRVASLKAHIMLHEKEESLMCTECGDEFSLQGQLDKHMHEHRQEQEGSRVYPCRQCTQEFPKPSLLREHMKQHYKIKHSLHHRSYKKNVDRTGFHHKCPHCLKTFQKPSQLERHIRIHTGERPYKCTKCNKAFNQKGALQIHMSKHTGKRPHLCQFCTSSFAQKGNLRAHIQRVHTLNEESTDGPVFRCEECTCVFRKLGSLNAHISRFHTDTSEVPAQVEVKQAAVSDVDKAGNDVIQQLLELSEQGMVDHTAQSVTTVTEVDDTGKQLQGDQSERDDILQQALENSGLTGAERNQQQSKGDTSNTAGGSSAQPSISTMAVRDTATGLVKKHLIRKVNGVRWHQCTYCTKEFKKPSDLVRHIRIHTHEKPYKCTQCFRAFAVKSTLTAHIRTHSGLKQFKCSICEKLFSTHGSLKVHIRLHTGAKPFGCQHCDRKFRTSAHRKSHVAGHFKDGGLKERQAKRLRRAKQESMNQDIPLQEPILITDTGYIQRPPRNNLLNQYLGDSHSVDRPYKCSFCQRGFKKSSHLKQHIRSHTGEKPYKCVQCMRSFVSNGVLKAHIRIHTGMKQYRCPLCDHMFTTNGSLKRHMSTHSEVRPFMCPYCQKTFKTSVNCKKHMKTHKHELALHTVQELPTDQEGQVQQAATDQLEVQEAEEAVSQSDPGGYAQTQQQTTDLGLVQQQELGTSSIMSQELNQQTSLLSQANLQEALGLGNSNLELQQTLNQQMFGQQQSFTQSLLGTGQQNYQTLNNQLNGLNQNQYTIQTQQQINSIDINTLTGNFNQQVTNTSSMPSTSMQNILQTREAEEINLDQQQDQQQTTQQTVILHDDTGQRNYLCSYCDKAFKKSSHLKQHIRSHTGEKPYACSQCDRTFVSAGVLRAHLRTHTGVKEYKCNVCNAMFTTNGSLTRHMLIHVNVKPFKCPYCLEGFRTSSLMKRHMKEHVDDASDDEAEADDLNKTKTNVIQLTEEHASGLTRIAPSEDITISQRILQESQSDRDRISELKSLRIETEEKHPHQCPHCVKSFKKPSDLVRHIRIHTGEKPYPCDMCGRTFTVKSTLDSHLKTHTTGGEKKFRCHVCSSMFSTKGSLKVHMRLHTGAKPFKCPHCPMRFRTSGHRKSHLLNHYKPEGTGSRKRKNQQQQQQQQIQEELVQPQQPLDVLNAVEIHNPILAQNGGQVINIDQSLLQGQNVMPVSVTVDNMGNLTESALAAHVLQGLEGIQLQLTGNAAQNIQITGLDPNLFSQTVQIDANLLQQLQQSGNVNITINPNLLTQGIQAADPNLVQVQSINLSEMMNNNILVQPLTTINMDGTQTGNQTLQQVQEVAPSSFVVAADGSFGTEQQISIPEAEIGQQQPQEVELVQQPGTAIPNTIETDINGVGNIADVSEPLNEEKPVMIDNITILNAQDNLQEPDNPLTSDQDRLDDDEVEEDEDEEADDEPTVVTETVGDDLIDDEVGEVHQSEVNLDVTSSENNSSEDRAHICFVCHKRFKRAGHLKEHQLTHARSAMRKDRPTPHKCDTCNKSFQKPSQLDRHMRIHTGERPFICSICSKAFNQKNALQIHLKKHSGERPHKCSYCEMAFTQKGNLKTHIKRAHHVDMVHSMNLPKTFVTAPVLQTSIDEATDANTDNTLHPGGLNLEEVADLLGH